MKIQLTIKTTYLPNWGAWEGIREVVQNGRDAEIEHSAPLKIDWYNDTLRVENEGVTLPLKALLLGHTTKAERSDTIGKFGEGLKLGILALVRAGHEVKIRNGSEVWTPTIERSETFDDDVLTFTVEKGRADKPRVRVEISGVRKEDWDLMRQNFLFVKRPKKDEAIDTADGMLLLGAQYKGKVYVKGIFVQHDSHLSFGYNLRDAELDRDRKMVESWNLKYKCRSILMAAVSKEPKLLPSYVDILEQPVPTPETEGMDSWSVRSSVAEAVALKFRKDHGSEAIPVSSLAESADVEHLGKKGVVVPKPLGVVLATVMGSIDKVKEDLRKEVAKTYSWHDLTAEEKTTLTGTIGMINPVEPLSLDEIEVVDFRSEDLMGQFKDGKILVAHKYLVDFDETLGILVHEVAHKGGDDGDKSHVDRIERIWKGIVSNLRKS